MIFITAKFTVPPQYEDDWIDISRDFTEATRSEDGCLWFEWARNCRNEHEYFVVEAFRDHDAAVAHVQSAHFIATVFSAALLVVITSDGGGSSGRFFACLIAPRAPQSTAQRRWRCPTH